MPLFPKQIYSTAKLWVKNAELPNLMQANFAKRWKHFSPKKLNKDSFGYVDGFFHLKEGVDINRYKGIQGVLNRFGANSRITRDKWNGTLKKALDEWVTHLANMR